MVRQLRGLGCRAFVAQLFLQPIFVGENACEDGRSTIVSKSADHTYEHAIIGLAKAPATTIATIDSWGGL
jgi:hypothetical protein